ncbi:hypothetical protein ACFX13_017036 [Malus domestica]
MTGESVGPSRVMDSKRPCDVGDHQLAVSNLCGTILSVQKGKSEKSHRDTHSLAGRVCDEGPLQLRKQEKRHFGKERHKRFQRGTVRVV